MRGSKKHFWLLMAMLLVVAMTTAALGARATAAQAGAAQSGETSTPTPFPPFHMVISEFRTRGPEGDNDEFVELYNPTGASINISGWTIKRSSDCGLTESALVTIASNIILQAGQHYLLISSHNSSIGGGDQTYSPGLTDSGGLALFDTGGNMIDAVGMCSTTSFREGSNLAPLSGNIDQSYERRPGGATACYDIGNNAADFVLISPSTPLNRNAPLALCGGVKTYTPTRTATTTPTRTPTRTATTIPGFVIIYAFLPHPHSDWNQDGQVNVNDEYIELINLSPSPISIKNWKLDNGAGTTAFILPDMSLDSRQIKLFFRSETGIPLSDGGGTVRLVKSDGRTADLFNYPPVEAMDRTWCRLFNGSGFLTFDCSPTPGRPNVPANPTPVITPTGTITVENPECSLSDTVPPDMTGPECSGLGGGIWQAPPMEPRLFYRKWKWPVFIE